MRRTRKLRLFFREAAFFPGVSGARYLAVRAVFSSHYPTAPFLRCLSSSLFWPRRYGAEGGGRGERRPCSVVIHPLASLTHRGRLIMSPARRSACTTPPSRLRPPSNPPVSPPLRPPPWNRGLMAEERGGVTGGEIKRGRRTE